MARFRPIAILLATLVLLALATVPNKYIGIEQAMHKTMDAGHFLAFGLFALLIQYLFKQGGENRATMLSAVSSGILIVAIEIIQPVFGRTAAFTDIATGLFGAAAFLLGRQIWLRSRTRLPKIIYSLFISAIFILITIPALNEWHIVWWRTQHFPLLAQFEAPIEQRVWRAQGRTDGVKTKTRLSTEHVRYGEYALKVETVAGDYSGVNFRANGQDWSPYTNLNIALYNPGEAFSLSMRIDDETPSPGFHQRYHGSFKISGGWNQ